MSFREVLVNCDKVMAIQGDCLEVLSFIDENSIDACVTDPPYGIDFMGNSWDKGNIVFDPEVWKLVCNVYCVQELFF